jgi:hypothetical protein
MDVDHAHGADVAQPAGDPQVRRAERGQEQAEEQQERDAGGRQATTADGGDDDPGLEQQQHGDRPAAERVRPVERLRPDRPADDAEDARDELHDQEHEERDVGPAVAHAAARG